ncbi:MAG: hypothetical protein JNK30_21205 [Phenylobacterium sp.]|uniref:hypothetical protein n=1 Tax=Phenylobacterium sp. TaxID=1871053 RepID=UPI001A5A0969|nr:hypothetical protein [Phenylobacterium sp.]MBL8773917.1 hypothetical protein [Phenylobacterium sp.]
MAGSAIHWELLDHGADRPVEIGDAVSAEAGGMPIWRVVGFAGSKAWLDDERGATRWLTSLEPFRWRLPKAA